ncbi:ribosomal protein S5 domain 2-type protein [Leucosporidium creatinivorum]|uniref:Ribosomal protein S5 domain 2-type protein n=1 Tax=Leucosporidium creatinivorum TaxID=106004 RepID=A0A1Y2F9U0_9BASI|nr:ribosomal protein S5 domain 2-type protein [Leucosporidium creatinivorum]
MDDISSLDSCLDLALVLSSLEASGRDQLSDELLSLSAIYDSTDDNALPALSLYRPTSPAPAHPPSSSTDPAPIRLLLSTTLSASEHPLSLLITLPSSYPSKSPPLLQLHSLYLSSFAVSDSLFGEVLRCYMHDPTASSGEGVEWAAGEVCLYEGVEWVRGVCQEWVDQREKEGEEGEDRRKALAVGSKLYEIPTRVEDEEWEEEVYEEVDVREVPEWKKKSEAAMSAEVQCPRITSSEALVDRKSVFVGHSATVHSLEEVHLVLSTLLSDKKIAKATHNISAFRFTTPSGTSHQDNDDDGESAAGSRLAHLLSLLDVNNVMVVVTRWYGGIHLGADRFKDINAVARDALQLGGYLDDPVEGAGKGGKGGKKAGGGGKKR